MKYTEQEIEQAIEDCTLYVKALNDVKDDLGVYCIKDKIYEVVEMDETFMYIETENVDGESEICATIDDKDFEFVIKEGD